MLLVLRLLYGIGMGGEWGLGAALAMEKIPTERRGFFSGVLQEGYSSATCSPRVAFLLVTDVARPVWRWLFALSIIPALITPVIRHPGARSPRSGRQRREQMRRDQDVGPRRASLNPAICAASSTSSCS